MAYIEHPSPWLGLGGFAVFGLVAATSRLQARIQPSSGRLAALDGLRGILAMSVFFHHFFISYQWKHSGHWAVPPTHLYNLMGGGSVTLFFMITGFLFFGRIKATRGHPDLNTFFAGRIFRLVPVYLVMTGLVFALVLFKTGSSWSTALQPALDGWLLFQPEGIAGYNETGIVNAGVHWTLVYEWLFYLALPVLAFAWTRLGCQSWALFVLASVTLVAARYNPPMPILGVQSLMFAPFALGGLVGEIGRNAVVRHHLRRWPGVVVCGLGGLGTFFLCETAYSVAAFLMLTLVFAPIAMGNTLFGILRTRTLMMLGEISYDVYLLHGVVLFGLYSVLMPDALAHAATPGRLFALLIIAGLCTLAVAVAVHLAVERPCLRLGRRLVVIDRTQELAAP